MKITDKQAGSPYPVKPLILTALLVLISAAAFLILSQHYVKSLFDDVENQYRQGLINIISVARNLIEPELQKVRAGEISREEAIRRIRPMIRSMTYADSDGKNYIFLTTYEGTSLVQPFDPEAEMTNRIDFRDADGIYITRELIRSAREKPSGSFVRYQHRHFTSTDVREKLTYVIGLQDIQCYMATGMYMKNTMKKHREKLSSLKYTALLLLVVVLIPVAVSFAAISRKNRQLLTEISIRNKTENELKKSEEKYRSIFENSAEGLYQITPGGNFISVNTSFAKIFGYTSPAELTDPEINVTSYYADTSDRERLLAILYENGNAENFTARFMRKDGTYLWASINSRTVRDESGNVLYLEGRLEDITARRQSEEKLRMSEEKFSKIFMTSPDGIIISRMKDGLLIDANEGAEKITGWKRTGVAGTHIAHDTFWADPADRNYMVSEITAGRDVLNREFIFRRKDGTERNGIFSARPINIAGESCLIIILRDITDKIHLEQQLAQSQKMDAIGKLAGGIAHDFNNILMIIQGNISLIMMKYGTGDKYYLKLRTIEENIQRGVNLTRQLLGFAREGKYEIRTLSVNELIRKSADFFLETRKEIEADLKLDKDIPSIEADAGQLEQVFLNIFINAAHAMPGGGRINIQTSEVTLDESDVKVYNVKSGDYVKISITDTGTGMDEYTLKRIFEPFFTTKSEEGGTGLGLASAYGIIRNHGGIINAYSEQGRGTTFNILLPASGKSALKDNKKQPDKALQPGSGTILLIDDEPIIMNIVSEMLKVLGYFVYNATDEQEAVSVYSEKKDVIDLVILDMILRGTSGAQVLKKLREINPAVRVILSSGYSLQGEVEKVMEMGCLGFIQKPYNFNEISAIIHKVLAHDS